MDGLLELKTNTPEILHTLAAKRGFEWIGTDAPNSRTKTRWRCPNGHEWLATSNTVRKGHGCPHCAGLARKTPADFHGLAASRGFTWVGDEGAPTCRTKTRWRCPNGHEWLATYYNLQRTSCPHCAGLARVTPSDYDTLAAKHGFEWIGKMPETTVRKTRWRCPNGHEWLACYHNIRKGHGCPKCDNRINGFFVSKPQLALRDLIGGEINYRVSRYGIDIALADEKIAVEYDAWYWHKDHTERDAQRLSFLQAQGWRVLRIKSANNLPALEQINAALDMLRNGKTYTEIVLSDWRGE